MKKKIAHVKRAIAEVYCETKSHLDRDRAMEVEESLIANHMGRDLPVATSGLEFDFSKVSFPELDGGPTTFWGGSFAEEPAVLSESLDIGFFVGSPVRAQNSRNI